MSLNHPLRRLAASGLFLLGCIILSVTIVLSIFLSVFSLLQSMPDVLNELILSSGVTAPADIASLNELSQMIIPIAVFFASLFSLLLASIPAVALFLIYFYARSSRPKIKTYPFVMLRVFLIISAFEVVYFAVISFNTQGDLFSSISDFAEALISCAMMLSMRKLLLSVKDVTQTGSTLHPINNRCTILILLRICICIGSLLLAIVANLPTDPIPQMQPYRFDGTPTLIVGFALSAANIAKYVVFYQLSAKCTLSLTAQPLSEDSDSDTIPTNP